MMPLAGAVEPDSSLDIAGISHSAVLPNLQLFTNAGFPFTRLADLTETTVILPSTPTTTELEMLLLLMSKFGAQSGNPAIRVTVAGPTGLGADGSRDTLVLGTPEDQPALQSLAGAMPVQLDANGLRIRPVASIFNPRRWWLNRAPQDLGELATDGGVPDAIIEQFNWPARSNRSVVAIVLHDAAAAQQFADAFSNGVEQVDIGGTATVLRGGHFSALAVAGSRYRVGENTVLERVTRALQQFPWIVAVVAALFCFLIAVLLQARLRRRARFRLQSSE